MFAPKIAATVLSALLVAAAVGPAATAATAGAVTSSQQGAYAGTHVSFETASDAVVDYAVDGETVLKSVQVQSKSDAESGGGLSAGVELSAVSNIDGSAVAVDSRTETSASVTADSGAELRAHDNARGILTVSAGEGDQYVSVDVSGSSQVESEGDDRVVVTTENGTQGAFIVVGDGEVAVNDRGNVSAELAEDSQLVFRTYAEGRDEDDEKQEQLISDGTAAAEVYVTQTSDGGETVADVVRYGENTTVEVTRRSESAVTMTVERTQHQGKVVIASVSDAVLDATNDVEVSVDGEAAARASSYSELRSAADDGDVSKFMLRQRSDADASADVLVAVNHFSERQITVEGAESNDSDGSTTTTGETESSTAEGDGSESESANDTTSATDESAETTDEGASASAPGFGVVVALAALFGVALCASRRS